CTEAQDQTILEFGVFNGVASDEDDAVQVGMRIDETEGHGLENTLLQVLLTLQLPFSDGLGPEELRESVPQKEADSDDAYHNLDLWEVPEKRGRPRYTQHDQ